MAEVPNKISAISIDAFGIVIENRTLQARGWNPANTQYLHYVVWST